MSDNGQDTPKKVIRAKPKMTPVILGIYRKMLAVIFAAAIFMMIVLALLVRYASDQILLFVVLSGGLGAIFSMLMRLYSLDDLPEVLQGDGFELKGLHLFMYSLTPILVGMIGAIFFHACIASGLISGDMFQQFKASTDPNATGIGRLLDSPPAEASDYAKCLVWGFVSGFSERLVPDQLQNLESPANKT